jgi:hypothetical protein
LLASEGSKMMRFLTWIVVLLLAAATVQARPAKLSTVTVQPEAARKRGLPPLGFTFKIPAGFLGVKLPKRPAGYTPMYVELLSVDWSDKRSGSDQLIEIWAYTNEKDDANSLRQHLASHFKENSNQFNPEHKLVVGKSFTFPLGGANRNGVYYTIVDPDDRETSLQRCLIRLPVDAGADQGAIICLGQNTSGGRHSELLSQEPFVVFQQTFKLLRRDRSRP